MNQHRYRPIRGWSVVEGYEVMDTVPVLSESIHADVLVGAAIVLLYQDEGIIPNYLTIVNYILL